MPESPLEGGPAMISGGGGPGRAMVRSTPEPEILPPQRMPVRPEDVPSDAARRLGVVQWREINPNTGMTFNEDAQRRAMGPMWKQLEEAGHSFGDIMQMNPTQAYQTLFGRGRYINVPQTAPSDAEANAALDAIMRAVGEK
jgi:hypothetical protein